MAVAPVVTQVSSSHASTTGRGVCGTTCHVTRIPVRVSLVCGLRPCSLLIGSYLALHGNVISGAIPDSISTLSKLTYVTVPTSNCSPWSWLLPDFGQQRPELYLILLLYDSIVNDMVMVFCFGRTVVMDCMMDCATCSYLGLSSNALSGSIPDSITTLHELM